MTTEHLTYYWHVHHGRLMEAATETIANRIAYIKANKPASEVPTRLRLLKVVADQERAAHAAAYAAHAAAYAYAATYDAADDAYARAAERRWQTRRLMTYLYPKEKR